jgi:Right handed beta helix region
MMRKVASSLAVCLGMGVIAPLAFASAAGASTTRVVHPGESIQAAVNASAPGDTVVVESGTYAQSVGIHTSGITLIGKGAKLVPPATRKGFDCRERGVIGDGICIFAGDPGDPNAPILDGVTVKGMTVVGFPDTGIFAINQTNLTYDRNTAIDNGEYGMAAFQTVGTHMTHNTASGAHEANFYLGDSPDANGVIRSNVSHDSQGLGIFVRDSQFVTVQDNDVRNNCAGVLVLADAPGPAGNVVMRHNTVLANNQVCPAAEGPPFSGIGIALLGAHDVTIQSNVIQGNVPAGPTFAGGGVVVTDQGPGSTAPVNNKVSHNVITGNSTDINDTGSGSGNVYRNNVCGANPGACS